MITAIAEWLLPPRIKTLLRSVFSFVVGFTKVDSWETAERRSAGYESSDVLTPLMLGTMEMRINRVQLRCSLVSQKTESRTESHYVFLILGVGVETISINFKSSFQTLNLIGQL
jgi:hypothetical protein